MNIETLPFQQFAERYCERQENTVGKLREILVTQKGLYQPIGWMLLECQMMDSSRLSSYVILPWGPNNTLKEIPTHPISPRGLASDMSVVVAITLAKDLV